MARQLSPGEEAALQRLESAMGPAAAERMRQKMMLTASKYDDLNNAGSQASGFADYAAGGMRQLSQESAALRGQLGRLASGQDSLSAEQLRQGLQQNVAGQQAMAATARPQNAAMAARTASMNAARAGSALSGQQAMAGIAERQAAQQALGSMLMQERGQDVNAALGGQGNAINAYSNVLNGKVNLAGQPTGADRMLGLMSGGIQAAGLAMSDRRLKTGAKDGRKDADEFIKGLKAYTYKYKGKGEHGPEGEHLGLMAQDLAKTKHGRQAVIETPKGLAVDGARLSTSLAAATARLGERLAKLEAKK